MTQAGGSLRGPDFQVSWPLMTDCVGFLYVPNTEWNTWLSSRHPRASGGALSVVEQGVAFGTRLDDFCKQKLQPSSNDSELERK